MYTIDITLKHIPVPLSVERKEAEAAEALYQKILKAMGSADSEIVELTCDKQEEKKVAICSDQITAVIVSQKSGAAAAGRVPGFFAAVSE